MEINIKVNLADAEDTQTLEDALVRAMRRLVHPHHYGMESVTDLNGDTFFNEKAEVTIAVA